MKLTFYGAARTVTGSCHCVTCNGRKVLIDCGLQQGADEWSNADLAFVPSLIDDVIVTHAHIDHSGRIPLLVKQGFRGRIFCTRLTAELMSIMLRDSAHIQESDAKWKNQKGRRAGKEAVEPLYTLADVEQALELIVTCEYGCEVRIDDEMQARFVDAGHLLGSAVVELWLTEQNSTRKIVFTGDLGNIDQPIIRDPQPVDSADYLVTESTYGDRVHDAYTHDGHTEALAALIDDVLSQGGNVIIPSFAVGRTQELLYCMREMKEQNLVKRMPDFQVCVDSPLANEATRIFSGDLQGYLDEEALEIIRDRDLFTFPNLRLIASSDDSRALNDDRTPKVIISAAGMCDAGRVRHHLKHNLWRPECAVVFVGFQAEGSLGRNLLEGVERVKLFGEEISVRAKIVSLKGMSSHADQTHLLAWTQHISPVPRHTFVVHGQSEVTDFYAQLLRDHQIPAHAPHPGEVYDLIENRILEAGTPAAVKQSPTKKVMIAASSPAYRRLELVTKQLQEVVEHNRGGSNKDLGKFTDQIRALIDKWER